MIIDRLQNSARYASMNPVFGKAFAFLASDAPTILEPGVHHLDGFRAIVMATAGHGPQEAALETHLKEIDVHFTVAGDEVIGWTPRGDLRKPRADYDAEHDVQLFDDEPAVWVAVPAGVFSIQFPGDGHAPLSGIGDVRKVVLKIADT